MDPRYWLLDLHFSLLVYRAVVYYYVASMYGD